MGAGACEPWHTLLPLAYRSRNPSYPTIPQVIGIHESASQLGMLDGDVIIMVEASQSAEAERALRPGATLTQTEFEL